MAGQEMKDYIGSMMDGWDGVQPENRGLGQGAINEVNLRNWMLDVYRFNRRVRRDILALERLLIASGVIDWKDLYGDPGDPPPPDDI